MRRPIVTRLAAIRDGLMVAVILVAILWALQYILMDHANLLQMLPGRTYYQ